MVRRLLTTATRKPQAVRKPAEEARRAAEKSATGHSHVSPNVFSDEKPKGAGHFVASNFIWGAGAMVGALIALNLFRAIMEESPSDVECEWSNAQLIKSNKTSDV